MLYVDVDGANRGLEEAGKKQLGVEYYDWIEKGGEFNH